MKRIIVVSMMAIVFAMTGIAGGATAQTPSYYHPNPKPHLHHCLRPGHGIAGIWTHTSVNKSYAANEAYSGTKLPHYVIEAMAESEGLPGVTMYQITEGESTGHPGMDISDPPGRGIGLYAVNTTWSPHSSHYLRNPVLNTHEAAVIASAAGGPNPNIWHGDSHVTGWDLHYSGNPRAIARHLSPLC